jgi:hypothetical protein
LGFCLIIWLGYGNTHRTERASAAADQQYKSLVECVAARGLSSLPICVAQSTQANYEHSSDYYDLKAQQDMAKWALLMLVVTSVGVVYVALTLNATTDIGHAQLRAYLGLTEVKLNVAFDGESYQFNRTIKIKNGGQTPARNVKITSFITLFGKGVTFGTSPEFSSSRLATKGVNDYADILPGECVVIQQTFECDESLIKSHLAKNNAITSANERKFGARVVVRVRYADFRIEPLPELLVWSDSTDEFDASILPAPIHHEFRMEPAVRNENVGK